MKIKRGVGGWLSKYPIFILFQISTIINAPCHASFYSSLSFIWDTSVLYRILTGYCISRRKCKNVARIDLNVWMVYIGTRGYINHGYSMEVDFFFTLKDRYVRREWRIMSVMELHWMMNNDNCVRIFLRIIKCSAAILIDDSIRRMLLHNNGL